ncbi:hypothetical protein ACN47E_010267 [Coniothyrium glycines]
MTAGDGTFFITNEVPESSCGDGGYEFRQAVQHSYAQHAGASHEPQRMGVANNTSSSSAAASPCYYDLQSVFAGHPITGLALIYSAYEMQSAPGQASIPATSTK